VAPASAARLRDNAASARQALMGRKKAARG
jgi:hypothetical protein